RDLPVGCAVRGGAGGAQGDGPAQARQLARALPGASYSARRLLRACWIEAAVGARGELRPGSSGAGAQARGGIGTSTFSSMVSHTSIATVYLVLGVSLGAHGTAWCQAAGQLSQDFYKNKQIRTIIGYPVGNDYDLAGRFLARYLAKHIPGEPTI